jgi:hypothetical protein
MGTIYEKTNNYRLDLYGNNDPADLRDGYNNSMRTIDATLETHLNRIEDMEARETHDEEVVRALLDDNTVDSATSAKTKWNKAVTDATSADSRLTSIGVTDITSGAALRESISRTNAILPSCIVTFDNIESMQDSNLLTDGMQCRTLGFYKAGDGGGAHYVIHAGGGNATANGMDAISCKNNLIAKLVADNNFLNIKRYGAHGDGISDDTEVLSYVLRKPRSVIYMPSGKYMCHTSIIVGTNSSIIGDELTNSSVNDAGTCLLMYDIPDTTDHTPAALTISTFNSIRNLYIKGNQWNITEDRGKLNPKATDHGEWMVQTAVNKTIKTIGLKSETVCYLQNITVQGFETGFKLSSQGNATQLMASKCVLGYNIYGDMRATSLQASSCIKGFFFGGGNVECSHLRCDGIFDLGYDIWNGGSFVDLSGDFIGNQMLVTYRFTGIVQNIRAARCCVNFADEMGTSIQTNNAQAYGVQLRTPQNAIISGLLVTGDESVGDSETEPTHNLKTIGNGIIISDMNEISNFTVDCESNAVPFSKTDNYTTQEIEKIIYVNRYASTEEKNNTYGRVRFRNSTIKVTKGIVEVQ